ncbi:hypothetical protein LTR78_000710 [Recurvomyces mirabilis]|uniref:F-box domain-containing protein n=1 Tax=Recurvomyces mirabilis TaxID=574656 RepID=A0AAE1C5S9_9PEZI|nr:hypothetical protein LTR78_000710 [Recurvomyces mirabilis]KAK5158680.1 hypothetical protein LTS14_002788 [Recurvomyces mirabilis]
MALHTNTIAGRPAEIEEGTAIIALYTSIPDQAKRLAALKQLVLHLGINEHLALIGFISERHDIAHQLPTELFQGIFDYLPLFSAWRLQLVSRRWRTVLSSADFLLARLGQEGRLPRLLPGLGEQTADMTLRRAVRNMQAQRLGRPFYSTSFSVPLNASVRWAHEHMVPWIALDNHTIAYIVKQGGRHSEVITRNLLTGSQRAYCGIARENILTLAMTGEILAFITSDGALYVASSRAAESQLERSRLPSAHIYNIAANEKTVTVLMPGNEPHHSMLAVYSAVTRSLHEYQFQNYSITTDKVFRRLVPRVLLLSAAHYHIDVFSSDCILTNSVDRPQRDYQTTISHQRFSLESDPAGRCLDAVQSSLVEITCRRDCTISRLLYTGNGSEYRVHLNLRKVISGPPQPWTDEHAHHEYLIMFDSNRGELLMEHHRLPSPLEIPGWLLCWKDVMYSSYADDHGRGEGICVSTTSHRSRELKAPRSASVPQSSRDVMHTAIGPPNRSQYQSRIDWASPFRCSRTMLGLTNGTFLVTVSARERDIVGDHLIVILGFDEDAPLAHNHATKFWNNGIRAPSIYADRFMPHHWHFRPKDCEALPCGIGVETLRRPLLPYEMGEEEEEEEEEEEAASDHLVENNESESD